MSTVSHTGKITNAEFDRLCESVTAFSLATTKLHLRNCTLSADRARKLAEHIVECSTLREVALVALTLTLTARDTESLRIIIDAVVRHGNITVLDLSINYIRDEGIALIADAFAKSPSRLRVLRLDCNRITAVGVRSLVRALPPTLERIGLNNNPIGDAGFLELLEHLRRNLNVVTNVDVTSCDITDEITASRIIPFTRPIYCHSLGSALWRDNTCPRNNGYWEGLTLLGHAPTAKMKAPVDVFLRQCGDRAVLIRVLRMLIG